MFFLRRESGSSCRDLICNIMTGHCSLQKGHSLYFSESFKLISLLVCCFFVLVVQVIIWSSKIEGFKAPHHLLSKP